LHGTRPGQQRIPPAPTLSFQGRQQLAFEESAIGHDENYG
jgi:hypothetical protein